MAFTLIGTLLFLLILGVPVAFALAITGLVVIIAYDLVSLVFIPQTVFSSLNSFTLLCIPFFILAGNIMTKGALAKYLLDFLSGVTRTIYGGKGIAVTGTGALFGAICGSSVACTAAVGTIGYPELLKEKYAPGFSQALISTSGALGIMIPPSIVFILIGASTGVSIPKLFVAGVIPGILETSVIALLVYWIAKKHKFGVIGPLATFKEWMTSFRKTFWALLLPVIILGGIYGGIFTPSEAAAVASVYAIIIAIVIYKAINFREMLDILNSTAQTTGMILLVVCGAMIYGYVATYARIPITIAEVIAAANLGPYQFLTIVVAAFLILGCFLDGISLVLITAPILYPILPMVNVDPIHFGVVMCTCIEIAQITPPVGLNMYVMSGIAKSPVETQLSWIGSFFFTRLTTVILLTYCPIISLWLVNVIY